MHTLAARLLTWAQLQTTLAPGLSLGEIEEGFYEQTGDPTALVVAVALWDTQPGYTVDPAARFDPLQAAAQLDHICRQLQAARRALVQTYTPPEIVTCSCGWVESTHRAPFELEADEYHCPQCGSTDLWIMTAAEAKATATPEAPAWEEWEKLIAEIEAWLPSSVCEPDLVAETTWPGPLAEHEAAFEAQQEARHD